MYFHTFFYPHIFSKKSKNCCLNTHTKRVPNYFVHDTDFEESKTNRNQGMHITCKCVISNLPETCKVLTNNTKPKQFVHAYLNYPLANYVVKGIVIITNYNCIFFFFERIITASENCYSNG